MKKRIIICTLVVLIACAIVLTAYSHRLIGHFSGAENEKVILKDGTSYAICDDYHTIKHMGWIRGRITGGYDNSYYVFSVRDDPSQEYIYVAAWGRGEFYKRIDE